MKKSQTLWGNSIQTYRLYPQEATFFLIFGAPYPFCAAMSTAASRGHYQSSDF